MGGNLKLEMTFVTSSVCSRVSGNLLMCLGFKVQTKSARAYDFLESSSYFIFLKYSERVRYDSLEVLENLSFGLDHISME